MEMTIDVYLFPEFKNEWSYASAPSINFMEPTGKPLFDPRPDRVGTFD